MAALMEITPRTLQQFTTIFSCVYTWRYDILSHVVLAHQTCMSLDFFDFSNLLNGHKDSALSCSWYQTGNQVTEPLQISKCFAVINESTTIWIHCLLLTESEN